MIEDYRCSCGTITEYKKPYGKSFPKTITCSNCGKRARRLYNTKKIIIPEEMRSVNQK